MEPEVNTENSKVEEENVLGSDDFPVEGQEEVIYHNYKLKKIQNLYLCPGLLTLSLRRNLISEITGLEHVPQLRELELYDNRIKKIEGLSHLVHLEILDLSYNLIRTIENLESLINLKKLYLICNKITEINKTLLCSFLQ